MEIFEKRGKWCFLEIIEDQGIRKLHKFRTEEEAKIAAGWVPPVEEILDGSKEEEDFVDVETPPVVEILEEEKKTPKYVKGKKK